jgi:hypothetical protein
VVTQDIPHPRRGHNPSYPSINTVKNVVTQDIPHSRRAH